MIENLSAFSIGKPQFLPGIFLILPALLLVLLRLKKIEKAFASQNGGQDSFRPLKISLLTRTVLRVLAWIFVILALSEISFGSKKVAVTKSGSNVSLIFDISYSMLAEDASGGLSRLDAAKLYGKSLVEKLLGTSFSVVLAKGDGFLAIPETEDQASVINLIENLSPKIMTSAGSSLAKGVEAALNAIPERSAKSQYIWIFTDGDETDNMLEKSLEKAAKQGISVTVIGFGSETEREILAGDGTTKVKTALRAKKLQEIAGKTEKHAVSRLYNISPVTYVDSKTAGSAWKVMKQIKVSDSEESSVSYELQNVNRHGFFIFLAVIFLMLSFVACSFNFKALKTKSLIFLSIICLCSCSSEKKQILDGVWAWYEGKYTAATADFLNVASKAHGTSFAREYALFDLSATYISIGELDASLDRLSSINLDDPKLPPQVRSHSFYNRGIIFSRKGEYKLAAENFKKAILADSKNINAKINLELCQRELIQKQAGSTQAQMQGVNEEEKKNPDMKNEIFNLIREQEGKKWRNMSESENKNENILDY